MNGMDVALDIAVMYLISTDCSAGKQNLPNYFLDFRTNDETDGYDTD